MEPTERVKKENLDDEKKKYTMSEVDTRTSHVDERLHSREKEGFLAWRARKDLRPERVAVSTDWKHEPLQQGGVSRVPVLSTLAFVISLLILGAAAWFGWGVLNDSAPPPQATAQLEVSGKKTLSSGETLELQVVVKNELPVPLELAELVITYPTGTYSAEDITKPIQNERLPLGTVGASSVRRGAIRSVIFGTSGEDKTVHVSLEYRVAGGSIIYQSLADHAVTIGSDTLVVASEGLLEVISGQSNDVTLTVTSQARIPTHDVVVAVEYPFGFTPQEVSPEEVTGGESTKHLWELGDFAPGESKKIYLRGTFVGEEGDVRIFKIVAGGRTNTQSRTIDIPLANADYTAHVKKPFLFTDIKIDGKKPSEYTFTPGQAAKVTVSWKNTLKVPLTNVSLGVLVGGEALKKTGIKVTRGFYRSTDSQVLWDAQTKPETFKNVAPGVSGTEEFQLLTLDDTALEGIATPTITFGVHITGKREGEQGVPESLEIARSITVPVATKATFTAEAKYFTSPFPQSGPLPPRVDTETVYAIEWHVASSSSDVTNGVVTATLPPNVRFRNIRTPISENLVYDDKTRTVTWYLGTVKKSVGAVFEGSEGAEGSEGGESSLVGGPPVGGKSVTFAVGLVPSASQLREEPDIVINQVFTGTDSFTKNNLEITAEPLNTILTEEGFDERFSPVVE